MKEYAELKEARLKEFRDVVEPAYLLSYLPVKACRGGREKLEEIGRQNDWELLLSSFQRSRIIKAVIKAGYPFYTPELQRKRSELYRRHYGLICDAVKKVTGGTMPEDLLSEATVAFLEGIDNLLPHMAGKAKPATYVFNHVIGRLREYLSSQKNGFTLRWYLKELCRFENADELISAGKVRVNGITVRNPKRKVSLTDEILVLDERPLSPSKPVCSSSPATQEDDLERTELWETVKFIVGELEGEALRLYLSGYTFREIGDELGVSARKAGSMVSRAMGKLRERRQEVAGFLG